MKLLSISYSETDRRGHTWRIDNFTLQDTNLIVGKNATGKSRALGLIVVLADLLSGRKNPTFLSQCRWEAIFKDGNDTIKVAIVTGDKVLTETLDVGDRRVLNRNTKGTNNIFAVELKQEIAFQTPDDKLACVVRRDSVQHPFLEPLYEWGASLRQYLFGTPLGKHSIAMKVEGKVDIDFRATDNVIGIFARGVADFRDDFINGIKSDLAEVGYDISMIEIGPCESLVFHPAEFNDSFKTISVREHGIPQFIDQHAMSQGMFRVLSLIIQLNYAHMTNAAQCIVIDDIGEGLDYERSKALIRVVVAKAAKSKVQLVMSTNDRFVMNAVPLEMWSVMTRQPNGGVRVYNYENSREQFDEFSFTGLNNFDFFAMDIATKGLSQ
jgi:hypothetical protein